MRQLTVFTMWLKSCIPQFCSVPLTWIKPHGYMYLQVRLEMLSPAWRQEMWPAKKSQWGKRGRKREWISENTKRSLRHRAYADNRSLLWRQGIYSNGKIRHKIKNENKHFPGPTWKFILQSTEIQRISRYNNKPY